MNALFRPVLVIGVVILLAVCVFGSHFACDSADLRELIRADRRGQELGRMGHAVNRHFASKDNLFRELIAQRCSLSEALERLQELDREWLQELERDWPDCTREMRKFLSHIWSDPEYRYGWITDVVKSCLRDRTESLSNKGYSEPRPLGSGDKKAKKTAP